MICWPGIARLAHSGCALAQGMAPCPWLVARGLIRALPTMGLAFLSILAAWAWLPGRASPRSGLAFAVVMAYGLFWVGLAIVVNSVSRSSAGAATFFGAVCILLVFVVPTLMDIAVEKAYPTPSRPEHIARTRAASGDAAARGGELLHSFCRDHPELAPPDQQRDFAAIYLVVQDDSSRAIGPVLKGFDIQLERQQEIVSWLSFLTPAIAAHEAWTNFSGTGFWRHRAYRRQVDDFKRKVKGSHAQRIHRREPLTFNDFIVLPRFVFREEPSGEWRRRVGASIGGILAITGGLRAWVWRRLGVVQLSASAA